MTTEGSVVFVDANVLVYATFEHFPLHASACARLAALAAAGATLHTSRQVVRDFLAVTTRPGFMSPMPQAEFLAATVRYFESRFEILTDNGQVTALLVGLLTNPGARGRQVHDANIVATMRHHQVSELLTHNTCDFERYRPWIQLLPLVV